MSKGDKPRGVTGVRNEEPPDIEAAERFELTRLKYGFWLLMTSIIVVSLIFTAAAIVLGDRLDSPAAVISLISTVTTLIGTLVGFYFGAQIGSSGYARAEAHRQETTRLSQQTAQRAIDAVRNGSSSNGPEGSPLISSESSRAADKS